MELFGTFAKLPIAEVLPRIRDVLRENKSAVLCAPPGSGTTTIVPLSLMDETWLAGKRILVLEPRRMAARNATWRMADLIGEDTGERVGYHIRLERRFSKNTRVLVLTEGLLSRKILSDPELSDTGLIIFDEFHERSIHADFGLALALDIQRGLRPDLRILIMSATLDVKTTAKHLGENTPIVESHGKMFPVETILTQCPKPEAIALQTSRAVLRALAETNGSVLAFLPGEKEIVSCAKFLESALTDNPNVTVYSLYAALSKQEQYNAIAPAPAGKRKIVLATSIAESSLTIEGISAVVDSGFARISKFSPMSGMNRLETIRITRDRADQRRGRAGRLGPGVCYRLWDENEDAHISSSSMPEITTSDLAPVVLQTADLGDSNMNSIPWLTLPPHSAWKQAIELLQELNALDKKCRITAHGRIMIRLGVHPRLAHAMLSAAYIGDSESIHVSCLISAILAERNNTSGFDIASANIEHILDCVENDYASGRMLSREQHKQTRNLANSWQQEILRADYVDLKEEKDKQRLSPGLILAWAYPDRIGLRRKMAEDSNRYALRNGRGVKLPNNDPLARSEWIVVADLDDTGADALVRLAAPISGKDLETHFGSQIEPKSICEWNNRTKCVESIERDMLGSICVRERAIKDTNDELIMKCLCDGIRREGIGCLRWTVAAQNLRARIAVAAKALPDEEFPDVSDKALLDGLEQWLGCRIYGKTKLDDVSTIDLHPLILSMLGAKAREIDVLAPTHLKIPSGVSVAIDYTNERPEVSIRLQQVFGMMETPHVVRGKIPVLMKLLSPAGRPVQITSDLKSFWANGYQQVRKDLRGRYPKHRWPEDPMQP